MRARSSERARILLRLENRPFSRRARNLKHWHRNALEMHQQFQQVGDDGNLQSFARNVLPVIQKHVDRLEQLGAPETDTGAANMPG